MVRISDIQDGQVIWDSVPYCNIPENDIDTYLLKKNDILFARTGGTVGKSYLVTYYPLLPHFMNQDLKNCIHTFRADDSTLPFEKITLGTDYVLITFHFAV
ncbi:MAG: hypothetical protein IJI75_00065, partial [Solobacterium sp.]|nr:hypothetical protein [Solobacterium sp.]